MTVALLISHYVLFAISFVSSTPLPQSPVPRIPFGNLTALNDDIAPGWVSSARSRGTADLLYSCIITLILCVYTAIHLNIPRVGEPKWKQYVRKAKWAAIGIFAPEFVVYTAWDQFWSARKLATKLNEVCGNRHEDGVKDVQQPPQDKERRKNRSQSKETCDSQPFNLVYGFYVVMGGFVVDVSDMSDDVRYRTLTTRGVLELARNGHFLRAKEHSIKDKSKADVLAKGLVCFQVTWLVVQCVARKLSGYPISLLELHTFVHVVCALIMYGLWFKKPLDIHDPTVADATAFQDLLARELIRKTRYAGPDGHIFSDGSGTAQLARKDGVLEYKILCSKDTKYGYPKIPKYFWVAEQESEGNLVHIGLPKDLNEEVVATLRTGQTLGSTGIGPAFVYRSKRKDRGQTLYYSCYNRPPIEDFMGCPLQIDLTAKTVRRWERTASVGIKHRIFTGTSVRGSYMRERAQNFQRDKDDSFDPFNSGEFRNRWVLAAVMLMLLLAYGGVHLSAWNFQFPSHQERIIWRISSLNLVGTGVFGTLLLYNYGDFVDALPNSNTFWHWVLVPTLSLLAIAYIFSRIYIVLESFISVRHLPIGVYAAVPWANYIPHL